MRAAVIINPRSGRRPGPPAAKADLARAVAVNLGVELTVTITERPGHGRDLAAGFAADGVESIVAWGGDGTINEVAGALAGTQSVLGIVPAGSGDGFARTLGAPRQPRAALHAALTGTIRLLDVGDVNGLPFLNLAGIGFDARVARRFNRLTKRGGLPYLSIGLHEGLTYRSHHYRLQLDDEVHELDALVVVFANGQQYGNGAVIAPGARFDDGLLDALVVDSRPFLPQLWRARRLFIGRDRDVPGIVRRRITRARVESDDAIEMHLDGECIDVGTRVDVSVRPGALRVRG